MGIGLRLLMASATVIASISAARLSVETAPASDPLLPGEGMWLPNALPAGRLKHYFDFEPSAAWAEHLRLASAHVGGASGSFVSPEGLVLTNQHVARHGLQNISGPGKDYVGQGFLAKTRAEEARLPGVEILVLVSIENVTERVHASIDPKLSAAEALKARRAVLADIARESEKQTGLQSGVVTLYGGARYHLYRSRRYTDVRAVFVAEEPAAFFGGDPDNFEYPRYCLDMALLRVYENDKPARVEHYLKWSQAGSKEGETVFVSGHPGRTDRLLPAAVLESTRDVMLPFLIARAERLERVLLDYGKRDAESQRQAQPELDGVQNGLKVTRAQLPVLKSSGIIERKRSAETKLHELAAQRPELRADVAAWDRLAAAEREHQRLFLRWFLVEGAGGFGSRLFSYARELVRLPVEDAKPDAQRLPEYNQARRAALEHRLLANEPIYPDLEEAKLIDSLSLLAEKLGADHAIVKKALAGKSIAERARELAHGSKLGSVAERRRLREGGPDAIRTSNDPMIELARFIDPESRAIRQEYEEKVQEPQTQAETAINTIRFALLGTEIYPDATGTLRLAFGRVAGYSQDGQSIPPFTTIGGAFEHEQKHGSKPPYVLPGRWHAAEQRLALSTPYDFVSTADITGGNSGSPVVNRAGELVGLIFDGNRQGLADNYGYSDVQARAVAVDSRAIIEALDKVYGAQAIVAELKRERSR